MSLGRGAPWLTPPGMGSGGAPVLLWDDEEELGALVSRVRDTATVGGVGECGVGCPQDSLTQGAQHCPLGPVRNLGGRTTETAGLNSSSATHLAYDLCQTPKPS